MLDLELLDEKLDDIKIPVDIFLEGVQIHLANMEDAIEINDTATISQEASAIKNSASNMMIEEMATIANEIEQLSKQNIKINYQYLHNKLELMVEELYELTFETA